MSELMLPSLKERLWHKMRSDLATYIPKIADEKLLMCCLCGRFLPQEDFDIEHLIPRQALNNDPQAVRENPDTPKNKRSGTILLCKKRLRYKNSRFYDNGCNSWKGRHYDKPISELLSGKILARPGANTNHILGALVLGYLAMVNEFGYRVCLMKSGVILRSQFFRPGRFHPKLGTRYKILLGGQPFEDPNELVWNKPFSFSYENGACYVTIRNFVIIVPADSDPSSPILKSIPFVPTRYAFQPDLKTSFQ